MAAIKVDKKKVWSTPLSTQNMGDVDLFDCSDEPSVEHFIKNEALKFEDASACRTHLFYYEKHLIGFFTLFTDYVCLPRSKRNSEGWEDVYTLLPKQSFPAIRLHYLGIDIRFRKQGLGELLLLIALDMCVEVSELVGFNFIVLEALQGSFEFFLHENFKLIQNNNELKIMAIKLEDIKSHYPS